MFQTISLFIELLHEGHEVADPKFWKDIQRAGNGLIALFGTALALAKIYRPDIPLTTEQVAGLAMFVAGLGNWVLTTITSKKVGLSRPPVAESVPAPAATPVVAASPIPVIQPVQHVAPSDPGPDLYQG